MPEAPLIIPPELKLRRPTPEAIPVVVEWLRQGGRPTQPWHAKHVGYDGRIVNLSRPDHSRLAPRLICF